MVFSKEEKIKFREGMKTAREDLKDAKNDLYRIENLISTKHSMKAIHIKNNNNKGISYCNGYLFYVNTHYPIKRK